MTEKPRTITGAELKAFLDDFPKGWWMEEEEYTLWAEADDAFIAPLDGVFELRRLGYLVSSDFKGNTKSFEDAYDEWLGAEPKEKIIVFKVGIEKVDEVRQALAAIGITLPEDNLKQDSDDTPDPV